MIHGYRVPRQSAVEKLERQEAYIWFRWSVNILNAQITAKQISLSEGDEDFYEEAVGCYHTIRDTNMGVVFVTSSKAGFDTIWGIWV